MDIVFKIKERGTMHEICAMMPKTCPTMGVPMVVAVSPFLMAVVVPVSGHPVAMGVWAMGMVSEPIGFVCHSWCAKKSTTS